MLQADHVACYELLAHTNDSISDEGGGMTINLVLITESKSVLSAEVSLKMTPALLHR